MTDLNCKLFDSCSVIGTEIMDWKRSEREVENHDRAKPVMSNGLTRPSNRMLWSTVPGSSNVKEVK